MDHLAGNGVTQSLHGNSSPNCCERRFVVNLEYERRHTISTDRANQSRRGLNAKFIAARKLDGQ